jgi:hypothetical protein
MSCCERNRSDGPDYAGEAQEGCTQTADGAALAINHAYEFNQLAERLLAKAGP